MQKVVLGARRTEQLQQIVEKLKAKVVKPPLLLIDVKDKTDLIRLVNTAVEQYGKLEMGIYALQVFRQDV